METKLNIIEILKDCPKGTKLYSPLCGECEIDDIGIKYITVKILHKDGGQDCVMFYYDGTYSGNGECMLFPSKENRDWNTFKTEKPKFDPKTLKHFDRVIVSDRFTNWKLDFFSHFNGNESDFNFICVGSQYERCIPYNDDTKHLIGTRNKAP